MNAAKRGFALICSLLFLLLLCLPNAVGATELNLAPEGLTTPRLVKPPDLIPPDTGTPGTGEPEEPSAPDAVATAEELIGWLKGHAATEGAVTLTADITLDDLTYHRFPGTPAAEIDTGNFTLKIAGDVELLCADFTIRGDGGEVGVLQVLEGGTLRMDYLTVEAREGLALVQEEGSGFVGAACLAPGANARYAETPYVWSWDTYSALVLVGPGEEVGDVLPATMRGQVNRNGTQANYEDIPMVWDLTGGEAAQEERLRFTAAGHCPGVAPSVVHPCTVVYDNGPLTFTTVNAEDLGRAYIIDVNLTVPTELLPIAVVLEYSFDGETWVLYEEETVAVEGTGLSYVLGKGPGEASWDTRDNLYIRLCQVDSETQYTSNILRFSAEDLTQEEDIGGNRGGAPIFPIPCRRTT